MKGITPSKEGIVLKPTTTKLYPEKDREVVITYKLGADILKDYIVESALDDMELEGDSDTTILDASGENIELQDFEIDALSDIFYDDDQELEKIEFDNNGNALVTFKATIPAEVYQEQNDDY